SLPPSATSGATGAPSSLSSSNSGPPKIPSSSSPLPKSGTLKISSASSTTARAARVAGAAALFSLFLTTRALRWASRAVSPAEFLHATPLLRQRQHGSRACGYQQQSATLEVVHCWHYNKEIKVISK
ncbi:hypothetical protein C0991_002581, partial [Blastosporella zonata]